LKVYQSVEEFKKVKNAVVTIGTFDGVHAGHQKILTRLKELAEANKGETVVLTFFPHPRMVLQPEDNDLKLITTLEERIFLLHHFGIDHLIVQPFSKEFSRLSAVEFVRDILVNSIGMKTLVIGHDHHFGRNREGSYKDLEDFAPVYNFRLEEIKEEVINEVAVSSTKIRKAVTEGNVRGANELLHHDFTIAGKVVEGDKLGRNIGFPTANISIAETYKLIPADGIYAVTATVESKLYKGMLYIGMRPVLKGKEHRIELNLFDFNRDIYGKEIKVHFKDRIRGDENFESMDKLKEKLKEDKMHATKMLS